MRFNPPPNWPPAPPGWAPESNWAPDPAWPPPPPGWQLWVDDTAPVPDYPTAPPQYRPYPPSWPLPPQPRSRKPLWIALGVVATIVAAVVGLAVGFGDRFDSDPGRPSSKPDITALTPELLVGRSAFPEIAGGKWISGVNKPGDTVSSLPSSTTDPPECADLYGDAQTASQTATATLANVQSGGLHSMRVHLAITTEQRDMKDYLRSCQSFTQTFQSAGRSVSTEVQLAPLDVAGVPPWAVATVMSSSSSSVLRLAVSVTAATITGYYRGVHVVASSNDIRLRPTDSSAPVSPDTAKQLVELFNAQIEQLEAAP